MKKKKAFTPLEKDINNTKDNSLTGFTLVEIMVVIGIILILAVILMPNMIRSKLDANESAAIIACKTIWNGLSIYVLQHDEFPARLSAITTPAINPPYIEPKVANAIDSGSSHNGYYFEYAPENTETGFTIRAHPKNNLTGRRHFFIDETGIIHYATDESVDAESPQV